MFKANNTICDGNKIYHPGDDVSNHPRVKELVSKGLAREIKTVKPDESKSKKPVKRRKQSD